MCNRFSKVGCLDIVQSFGATKKPFRCPQNQRSDLPAYRISTGEQTIYGNQPDKIAAALRQQKWT